MPSVESSFCLLAICSASLGVSAAAERNEPTSTKQTLQCGDIAVFGTLHNNDDYQSAEIPDDVIGHGFMTARVKIRRVIFGKVAGRWITISYFGHTYYRDGITSTFVLRPLPDGLWSLVRAGPKLKPLAPVGCAQPPKAT